MIKLSIPILNIRKSNVNLILYNQFLYKIEKWHNRKIE